MDYEDLLVRIKWIADADVFMVGRLSRRLWGWWYRVFQLGKVKKLSVVSCSRIFE